MRKEISDIRNLVRSRGPIDVTTLKHVSVNPFEEPRIYKANVNKEDLIHELRGAGFDVTIKGDGFTVSF